MPEKFELSFSMLNAAFSPNWRMEAMCILRELIQRLDKEEATQGKIRDGNGNIVGEWSVE